MNYSHDTRNCNTLKDKTKKGALNEAINKNLIIQEISQEIKDVVVEGKIGNERIELIIDTGSKRNYVNINEVERLRLITKECKSIKTVFGNGDVKECKHLVNIKLSFKQ